MAINIEITQNTSFPSPNSGPGQFQIITADKPFTTAPATIITVPTVLNGVTFTPIDLTGATVKSQIRSFERGKEKLLVTFNTTIVDAVTGQILLSLTPAQTSKLPLDVTDIGYDVHIKDSNGVVTSYISGEVTVVRGCTDE